MPTSDGNASSEARRLERVYSRYAESRRKRSSWAADNPGNLAIRRELVDRIEREAGAALTTGRVLDVGCGSGWLLRALADRGAGAGRLYGVDLLSHRVDEARRRLGDDAQVELADAERLPFPDRNFDVVLLLTLLSSMKDAPAVTSALSEARRVLRRGGVVLVYEPRVPNPLNRDAVFVSSRALKRGLGSDLDQVKLTVLPPLSRRLGRLTGRLYPRLARIHPLLTHRLSIYRAPS